MYASTIFTAAIAALCSISSVAAAPAPFEFPTVPGILGKRGDIATPPHLAAREFNAPAADFGVEKRQVKPSASTTGSAPQSTSTGSSSTTVSPAVAAYLKMADQAKVEETFICQYNVTRGVVGGTRRINMFSAAQDFSGVDYLLYALPQITDVAASYTLVPLTKGTGGLAYADVPVLSSKPLGTNALLAANVTEPITGLAANSFCYFEVDLPTSA